ncbi:MAG: pyridoxamine 5'-phosphate oxidase family protein, partial [Pseudorhodobacter sp.]|nr:pyridoxamine 5'-phosphate oxidase family protein [Pseudorhodobacter sp.]
MKPDLHPWASELSHLHAEVWLRLSRGVHDRHAPARHPTLATVSVDGRPQARTVVLRAADKPAGTLDIHTDLYSAKFQELRATPFAALHMWDPAAHLQVRLEA